MKVKINKGNTYIQNFDLDIIDKLIDKDTNREKNIPYSITNKINIRKQVNDITTKNNFVLFNDPESIEYLDKQEWLVDYNDLRLSSLDEIKEQVQNIKKESGNTAIYKLFEYDTYLDYLVGKIDYKLPEGAMISNYHHSRINKKSDKSFKSFIKKLF